jgi:hypothetical protein
MKEEGHVQLRTGMRLVLCCVVLTSCTIGGPSRMRASSPHPLATVPSEALDHQNPGADTSKNRTISHSVAEQYRDPPSETTWHGGSCDALTAIGFALAVGSMGQR